MEDKPSAFAFVATADRAVFPPRSTFSLKGAAPAREPTPFDYTQGALSDEWNEESNGRDPRFAMNYLSSHRDAIEPSSDGCLQLWKGRAIGDEGESPVM